MSLHTDWEHHGGYSVVRLSGNPSLGEIVACLELVAGQSLAWTHGNLLVDMRGVTSLRSFTEQFTIGEEAARKLGHLRKIASVVPPDRLTRNSERPARKKGLNLLVFTSDQEAVQWLDSEQEG